MPRIRPEAGARARTPINTIPGGLDGSLQLLQSDPLLLLSTGVYVEFVAGDSEDRLGLVHHLFQVHQLSLVLLLLVLEYLKL